MAHGTTENFYNVPLKALSTKTEKEISSALNTLMILPATNSLLRDWRGLAELLKIEVSLLEKQADPTHKLLELAQKQTNEQKYTVEVLLSCLEALNRFDVIDDCQEFIDNDIREFCARQNSIESTKSISQKQNESYDAMVLYAEADTDFAYKLVDDMEKNYDLKLFVKDRDLKAGDKEVQATLSVIADRSNKLIVILTPDFLTNPMNEFFLDYAQSISIEQQSRKIIPCILSKCQIPLQLFGLYPLRYTANNNGMFWTKLATALTCKNTASINPRILETKPESLESQQTSQLVSHSHPQQALCPPVSNNYSKSQKLSPISSLNSQCASTSYSEPSGSDRKSTITRNNSTNLEGEQAKSPPKKKSSFLTNVKTVTTKLLPKSVKKKKSEKQKKKIAVAS